MFNALAAFIAVGIALAQPGRIIEESELPPPGEQPRQAAPQQPAPVEEQPRTTEGPSQRQAPEVPQVDAAPDVAEQPQQTQESPRAGGRVMAFWMISPEQANP